MVSLSLVLKYVIILLINSNETLSLRLMRSTAQVAQIGADDYPSTGRNTPVHDLGFPEFPSFQEAVAPPPPPPDLPFLPPSPPDQPLLPPSPPDQPPLPQSPPDQPHLPPSPPDLPLLPPPAFPDPEKPRFAAPGWSSLPDFPPFPFVDHQAAPSEPLAPRFDESDTRIPSTPSNP